MKRITFALVGLLLLASCGQIPTSGPVVEYTPKPKQGSSAGIEIAPLPPVADASPEVIAEGFLYAMSTYQPGYLAAREYLTPEARERWKPEQGLLICGSGRPIKVDGTEATVDCPLVGRLDSRGKYAPAAKGFTHDLGLIKNADGQWRISNPPQGLLISSYLFERSYRALSIYFLTEPGDRLVPEQIYLPTRAATPKQVLAALLRGPTEWYSKIARSAFPAGTTLNTVDIPVDDAGVARISLSEQIDDLTLDERSQLVAQLVWSMSQFSSIRFIELTVNGQPYLTGAAGSQGRIAVPSMQSFAPVPSGLGSKTLVADLTRYGWLGDQISWIAPLPKPLASGSFLAALNRDADEVVIADHNSLLSGKVAQPLASTPVAGMALRPQYTEPHVAWAMATSAAATTVYRMQGGDWTSVRAPALANKLVLAFRISPEGSRVALILSSGGRKTLAFAQIQSRNGWSMTDLKEVPLADGATKLDGLMDVAWTDATSIMVLSGASDATPRVWRCDASGARLTPASDSAGWNVTRLATVPQNSGTQAYAYSPGGLIWTFQTQARWKADEFGYLGIAYAGS